MAIKIIDEDVEGLDGYSRVEINHIVLLKKKSDIHSELVEPFKKNLSNKIPILKMEEKKK